MAPSSCRSGGLQKPKKLSQQRRKGKRQQTQSQQSQMTTTTTTTSFYDQPGAEIGMDRYSLLEIGAALSRRGDYTRACHELALVLRTLYKSLSKSAQAALFEDVLSAFQLLPRYSGRQQTAEVTSLLRAVEAVLPKQRKMVAVSEYKKAALSLSRGQTKRSKEEFREAGGADEDEEIIELPVDVMDRVLRFLDPPSLVAASSVCRSWHELVLNEALWEEQYRAVFGVEKAKAVLSSTKRSERGEAKRATSYNQGRTWIPWRKAFAQAAWRTHASFLESNRAYCVTCRTIFWLSSPSPEVLCRASTAHDKHDNANVRTLKHTATADDEYIPSTMWIGNHSSHGHIIKPLSSQEVLRILEGGLNAFRVSDSDSEEEEEEYGISISRMWAAPRISNMSGARLHSGPLLHLEGSTSTISKEEFNMTQLVNWAPWKDEYVGYG